MYHNADSCFFKLHKKGDWLMKDLLYEDLVKAMGMIDEDKTQHYAKQMIEEGRSPLRFWRA